MAAKNLPLSDKDLIPRVKQVRCRPIEAYFCRFHEMSRLNANSVSFSVFRRECPQDVRRCGRDDAVSDDPIHGLLAPQAKSLPRVCARW